MIAVIIQARMGSTRLPGKVLMPIAGRPMLSYQIERLRRCRRADRLIVATSVLPADDPIVAFCTRENVSVARGSESDVLARYALAAQTSGATVVVRITSDCPLIEPALIDEAVSTFLDSGCDYLSNMVEPTWPYGMAVEVMSRRALDDAATEACDPAEREHVTPFVYWRPERYRIRSLRREPDLSGHRWTVDTIEDFELVSRVICALYPVKPEFTLDDVLELLARRPYWSDINRHVIQKTIRPSNKEFR